MVGEEKRVGVVVGVESGMVPKSTPHRLPSQSGSKKAHTYGENYCPPTPILKVGVQDGSLRLDEKGDGRDGYRTGGLTH